MSAFSLPTQRCFLPQQRYSAPLWLFSAYAEVFPPQNRCSDPHWTFLCLRRGVSHPALGKSFQSCFSLPTQRCFRSENHLAVRWRLFSAYAEVFPPLRSSGLRTVTFLCLRRGVSPGSGRAIWDLHFSLPTQRCFSHKVGVAVPIGLFSAYAEVFLLTNNFTDSRAAFLCLRRGVSRMACLRFSIVTFSLPTQRCFLLLRRG